MEPTASDPRYATVRHGRRHSRSGPSERARDAQHPRRALRDLQRRVRRAPSTGPLPAGAPAECDEFRKQPDAVERAIELDRHTGATPILLRCRSTASRCRSRPSTTRRTCARPAAATSTMRTTSRRPTRRSSRACAPRAPSSTRRRTTPSTTAAAAIRAVRRKSSIRCSRPAARARRGAARPATPTIRRAKPAARGRLGRIGRGQSRGLLDLRIDGRLVPQPRYAQRRRHVRADEGHDLVRRRHRRRPLSRSPRHHLPTVEDTATVFDAFRDRTTGSFFDARDITRRCRDRSRRRLRT